MCCNLRTHVKGIAIICIILSVLGSLRVISALSELVTGVTSTETDFVYGGSAALVIGIHIPAFVFVLISEILCLVGAIKNNKCFLVPFMIVQCLTILLCIGLGILFIYFGIVLESSEYGYDGNNDLARLGRIVFFMLLIPLLIVAGLAIYFLVIVAKFYSELSSGIISGEQPGIVLQPYISPQGIPTVYDPLGTQNATNAYQQQPATSPYPQQSYAYPLNNPGVKIQA